MLEQMPFIHTFVFGIVVSEINMISVHMHCMRTQL